MILSNKTNKIIEHVCNFLKLFNIINLLIKTFFFFIVLMSADDILSWEKQLYESTYKEVTESALKRKKGDLSFTKELLQKLIDTLYINVGNDMTEKGQVFALKNEATIDAYEAILRDWDNL